MARARRPRYVVTGKMRFNDHDAKGQIVVLLGNCTSYRATKKSTGKPLSKKDQTHRLFRFEDKKWLKDNGLIQLSEFCLAAQDVSRFLQLEG